MNSQVFTLNFHYIIVKYIIKLLLEQRIFARNVAILFAFFVEEMQKVQMSLFEEAKAGKERARVSRVVR